jgi:uncharacterized protein YraI
MGFFRAMFHAKRPSMVAAVLLAFLGFAVSPSQGQVTQRAEPVTGPGVTTIGGIAPDARVSVRSGPGTFFTVVGTLGYGTRVRKGPCIGGGSAQWCQIETMDGKLSGHVAGRFLVEGAMPPPDDGLAGGPDYWEVRGLGSNERLGVRLEPKVGSPALATLRNGEIVSNLGCRMTGSTRWCRIRSITGMDVTGWVNGRYLRESRGPVQIQPPVVGGSGGDMYVVSGLSAGDRLNVRSSPSTQGAVVARLSRGVRVENLGCERSGQTRWCQIRTSDGIEIAGWVNGRYLQKE